MVAPVFEKVLEEVGDSGRYQRLLYWLYVVPINFLIPWVPLAVIFMTSTPDHWCHVPGRPDHVPLEEWKALTIPREKDGAYSSCQQYNVTAGDVLPLLQEPSSPELMIATFGVTECRRLWEYDRTYYDSTLSTQQHWVCEQASMAATWQSVSVAGNVVGTVVFNSLSDLIGRLPVLAMTVAVFAVFGLVRLYVTSLAAIMITTFLASTSFPSMLELALIIVLEQVSPGWRTRITSTSFILWTGGMCLLPLLAWATRDWQLLGLITTLPFFIIFIGHWVLPESPRWLLSRNRLDRCSKVLENIAAKNGRKVPESLQETLQAIVATQRSETNYGAVQLFKYRVMAIRTLLLTACFTCYNLFYYGLTYNMANVSGNEFLNFFLLSIVELPSNLLGWFSAQNLGRRWTAAGAAILAGVCAFATAFLQDETPWIPLMALMVSKMFITISFLVVYVQCAEVYPTTHRAAGTGLTSIISSCFGITAPYIAYLVSGAYCTRCMESDALRCLH
uniref:Major facilitator superfamily (MFS) profile domain-containing protein n=1 Tax=Scylla olivacea TaxID=85551 RepID=A0A0P4WHF6_SCYOL